MATTTATLNAASIPQVWATDLFEQAEDLTFWSPFEGPVGSSMPVIRRDDLTREPGDTIKVDVQLALTSPGITGELSSVEGNEEALNFRQISMPTTDFANGVSWDFKSKAQITHDLREQAKRGLAKWLAGKLDNRIFSEFTGVTLTGVAAGNTTIPTLNKMAAGTATSRDTVADTAGGGKLTLASIVELKAYAQSDRRIEPLRVDGDGNEYFGLVAHPYAIMELKRDDTAWAQAQRDARLRGDDNPVFTGAVGMYDGVLIYPSNRVPRYVNAAGTPIAVSDNIFFGAQALSRGYSMYPTWVEEEFDYERKAGIATTTIVGEKVNAFDLTAAGGAAASAFNLIGSMVLYTAAVAPGAP